MPLPLSSVAQCGWAWTSPTSAAAARWQTAPQPRIGAADVVEVADVADHRVDRSRSCHGDGRVSRIRGSVARGREAIDDVRPDETGPAGDEDDGAHAAH